MANKQYAKEAGDNAKRLRDKNKKMNDSQPIGGKSAKMGENFYFNDDGSKGDTKAASQAYDARMNQRESEAEDQEKRKKLNEDAAAGKKRLTTDDKRL